MDRTCFRRASATLDDENRQSPLPAWTMVEAWPPITGGTLARLFPRFAGGPARGGPSVNRLQAFQPLPQRGMPI